MKNIILITILLFAYLKVFTQIILSNDPIPNDKILAIEPLIGFHPIIDSYSPIVCFDGKTGLWAISYDSLNLYSNIITKKFGADSLPQMTYNDSMINIDRLFSLSHMAKNKTWLMAGLTHTEKRMLATCEIATSCIFENTEMIYLPKKTASIFQKSGNWIAFDPEKLDPIIDAFDEVGKLSSYNKNEYPIMVTSNNVVENFTKLNSLKIPKELTQIQFGKVTYGVPVVTSAAEEQMNIPESILKRGNVYVVKFAVSFAEIDPSKIESIFFSVKGNSSIFALELIPLKYGTEMNEEITSNTPNLSINGIEIGTFYEKSISYKYIKPTIIGSGLQESNYLWIMKEQAISEGSQRFIAILLVPNNQKKCSIEMQVYAKQKGWLPLVSGSTFFTQPHNFILEF